MSPIDVAVVAFHYSTYVVVWQIKRVAPSKPWLGWAKGDGIFTPGINPTTEGWEEFRTAEYAVEFAQEHGWNVVSIIRR